MASYVKTRKTYIAVLGDLCLDLDVFPNERYGNYYNKFIDELYLSLAGSAGNVAVGLSAMGFDVKLIAPVAEDLTYQILDVLAEDIDNLEIYPIKKVYGSTCFIVNIVDSRGVRRVFSYPGPEVADFKDVRDALYMRDFKALYISGYFLEMIDPRDLIELLDDISKRIRIKVFDLFPRIQEFKNYIKELLPKFTIVSGNHIEFNSIKKYLWPEPVKYLLNRGVEIVAIKEGAKGAKVYTRDNVYRSKPFSKNVKYLKGAGDVFNAVFLGTYIREENIKTALLNAIHYASMHISGKTILRSSILRLV